VKKSKCFCPASAEGSSFINKNIKISGKKEADMDKKGTILVVCTLIALGPAFAELPAFRLSAGGGGLFMTDMGEGSRASSSPSSWSQMQSLNEQIGGGAFIFFDATFAELTLGFHSGSRTAKSIYTGGASGYSGEKKTSIPLNPHIGLWGKYPFQIGSAAVFPILGLNYVAENCVWEPTGERYLSNIFWFMAGAGADFSLTPAFFLRADLLYGLHFQSGVIKKIDTFYEERYPGLRWEKNTPGHGLQVRVGAGYRF
jgi:hypothetical protein